MSENLQHNAEKQSHVHEYGNQHQEHLANLERQANASHHEHAEHIEHIRSSIEREAKEADYAKETQPRHEQQPSHHYITKKIKAEQYRKTLKHIQEILPKRQQRFSAFVHQPTIERISEVGAKTIARPSGILGGALLALVGSLVVLYTARRIGFEIPNSIFAILFALGFVAGICFELATTLLKKLHPKHRQRT